MTAGAPVAAVDVGGTTVKGAVVAADGTLHRRVTVATPADPAAALATVRALATDLAPGCAALGVVTPGVVRDGTVVYAANLGWRDVPLGAVLAGDLARPVGVGHDVRAAALAQARADGDDDVLVVVLGTGIAAAHVVGGEVRAGAAAAAGELGHVPVRDDGEPCGCGQRGCLEVYASGGGLARRSAAATGGARTAADLVARLGTDPVALRLWAEGAGLLGRALATATLLLDPARILLAGGLAAAGDTLAGPVRTALADALAWRPAPPLGISALGADVGLHGAALVARDAAATAPGISAGSPAAVR